MRRDRITNNSLLFLFAMLALISMACNNPLQKAIDDKLTTVAPTIAPGGGKFLDYKDITITCDAAGAEIRYTTDGSDPTSSGTASEYASPFRLNYDCTLTVAAKSGKLGWSPLVMADFSFDYSSDTLDPTFGPHTGYCGLAGNSIFYPGEIDAVALQSDGKIIVAGEGFINNPVDADCPETYPFIARLTSSGVLDSSFGAGGYVLVQDATYCYGKAQSIAIDSQDRIYFQGFRTSSKTYESDFRGFVGRLSADGSVDTTYGTAGIFSTPQDLAYFDYSIDGTHLLALDPSSNAAYFALGYRVYRLTASGAADTTFSGDGRVETNSLNSSFGYASGLGIQSGRLVIVGSITGAPTAMRLTSSGGLDSTFGSSGISSAGIHWSFNGVWVCDLAIVSDGIITLSRGALSSNPTTDFAYYFAKFNTDGGLNNVWGQYNGTGTSCNYDTGKCNPSAIAVLKDGSIIAGGNTTTAGSSYWTTLRLDSSGLPAFNRPDITGLGRGRVLGLTVQSDGKYIAVGYAQGKNIIARYWP